ncbi:hypothetical protein HYW35_03960 [Candidatus Saccharibacteria bacterium]|nr:hypothetical protein [Candidatus Saccharibacteria bacterium]
MNDSLRSEIIERQLPSRRLSVSAFTEEGLRIYANTSIARKLYKCAECLGDITIGAEHTVVETLRRIEGYTHHHLHQECFWENTLPNLGRLAIIKSTGTTKKKINRRRYR